jgi:uncharacterized 2Fe-2S/4Fe-4S cluster protein (DUF4445 family)
VGELRHAGRRRPLIAGRTLFDHADELELVVPQTCRRTGRCRECVVEVRSGETALSAPSEAERYLRAPYRLACQAVVERDDVDVEVDVLRRRLQIQAGGATALEVPADALEPAVRRAGDRVVTDRGEDLGPWVGGLVGLAVDIGTTTVVADLVDLESGALLRRTAMENPQRFAGSDVVARIAYDGDAERGELQRALRRALDHELRAAMTDLGLPRTALVDAVLVGNPTMRDIAFGLDVDRLGRRPFRSTTEAAWRTGLRRTTALVRRAHEVGLWMLPQGRVYGAPVLGSHVGADIAADLVAVDMAGGPAVSMLVDIGTNSEVVVRAGDRWLAASCPAGPAFEGGGVGHGMPAVEGAVQAVRLVQGRLHCDTIGGVAPDGFCGSGLIDLLAVLRESGRLRPDGRFDDGSGTTVVDADRGIELTRADVSHLAQAKAANACGQAMLLEAVGVRAADVERLWLAGGFATYVDVPNAMAIGLLPPIPRDRVVKVGNGAILGAGRLLRSIRRRRELEDLVTRIDHLELELDPRFFDRFVDGLRFEPQGTTSTEATA